MTQRQARHRAKHTQRAAGRPKSPPPPPLPGLVGSKSRRIPVLRGQSRGKNWAEAPGQDPGPPDGLARDVKPFGPCRPSIVWRCLPVSSVPHAMVRETQPILVSPERNVHVLHGAVIDGISAGPALQVSVDAGWIAPDVHCATTGVHGGVT